MTNSLNLDTKGNINELISQLITELKYNPHIGSELDVVKKRFIQNISKMNTFPENQQLDK